MSKPSEADEQLSASSLLTAADVGRRLKIDRADPTRWLRRLCRRHAVTFIDIAGAIRLTERQYQHLLERMSCSACDAGEKRGIGISVERSRSAATDSTSQNIVRAHVTRLRQGS